MIAMAEVPIPIAVLIKASEIPAASAPGSGLPVVASAAKALIIPITVPRRATSVATDATLDVQRHFPAWRFAGVGIDGNHSYSVKIG